MGEPAPSSYLPEVEQQVIGTALLAPDAIESVSRLRPEHFQEPLHQRLWTCIAARRLAGEEVAPSLIAPLFRDDPGIGDVGGVGYIARLAGAAVGASMMRAAAAALVEAHERAELRAIAAGAADAAMDMARKPREVIESVESALLAMMEADERQDRTAFSAATEWLLPVLEARQNGESLMGVCAGLGPLDDVTGGLLPGDLTVLAGRPGMGKSVVGLFYAWAVARTGKTVLFSSLEMSEAQVSARLLALETWAVTRRWVPYRQIMRGDMDDLDAKRVFDASQRLRDIPLRITDPSIRSIGGIAAAARRAQRIGAAKEQPLALVVIDYLGLVQPPRQRQSKVNEIGDITGGLKTLAQTMGVPVLLLSQLNRGVEQRGRDDRKPVISDLRDSGDIEQDADRILLLYRPAYYLAREEPDRAGPEWAEWREAMDRAENAIEIDVAKNRMGETGRVTLWCAVGICAMAEINGGPPA